MPLLTLHTPPTPAHTQSFRIWYFLTADGVSEETGSASADQISSKSVKRSRRYGNLNGFQNGGSPPSWIFEILTFYRSGQLGYQFCIIVPNFVKTGQSIAEISQFSDFQDGGRHHLGFSKVRNFNSLSHADGQHAPLRQIPLKYIQRLHIWQSVFQKNLTTHDEQWVVFSVVQN